MSHKGVYYLNFIIFLIFFSFILILSSLVSAVPISATTNKIIYAIGDSLIISGTVNTTGQVDISFKIYNSTTLMNSTTVTSSGTSINSFSISNKINASYSPGNYFINLTSGSDTLEIGFKVVPEIIYLEPHLIGNPNKTFAISTVTRITNANANYAGGNFSELIALSQNTTKAVFYGNASIPLSSGNKMYHFVLVDENSPESYDVLYVDDDKIFSIYNTSEDVNDGWESERIKGIGDGIRFNSTDDYIVNYIDFVNGNEIVLSEPISSSTYSPGDPVYFVIISKDSEGGIEPNQLFEVNIMNSSGYVFATIINETDDSGIFILNYTPSDSGRRIIDVNDSLGLEFFKVETFKLYSKITDLLDNPTYTFSQNSKVKISAILKYSNNTPVDSPDEIYATVKYPNGTSQSVTLTGGNGTFSRELNPGSLQGEYGVKITATVESERQEFSTGFAIKSVMAEVIAINPEFLGETDEGTFVNSFASNDNVSLLVVLSDVERGGLFARGPEGEGVIDIDDPATAEDECKNFVSVISIQDDRGKDITNTISYQIMNVSNFINFIGGLPEGEEPPSSQLRQCMIVFPSPNRTGIYRIKVNVKYGGDNFAGTTFAIQKYYATANPVDFTGEKDFWFYPPNTSIYIKLKVTDLSTREELNASKIVDAKILEMSRQWPSYTDMLSGSYRPNEAIVPGKGVLNFTTPESEGFFTFRFKFKTETGEEGLGTGFFMLKKYMIWGEPVCGQEGFCHFAPGSNITLNVKIVPIKDAEKLSKGMTDLSQIGYCTDCDGLIVSVDSIFNDQLMREIPASDYTVYNGTIFNSSANITIQPNNMPTGWFGVDLILTDPADPTKQYIGWTGFEIRRFLIITDNLEVKDGKITRKEGGGMWGPTTFGLGQEVLFAVQAMNPANFQPLPIHTVIVETVTLMSDMGPPVTLKSSDYQWSAQNITVQGFPWSVYVVNITGVNKTGNFQVTFRVVLETNSSDVWNYGFMMSRYLTETEYRGMNQWPPTFAPNENLTVNVSAFDVNEQPHNLSKQGTRLKMVNKMKTDTRLKLNYSVECVENKCTIDIYCPTVTDLSCLGSGEFSAIIGINDTQGVQMEEEVYFEIKGLTVSIPSIEEFWIGRTDTTTKEFELGNDRDTCENERWLNFDELPGNFKDSSPGKVGNGVLLHDNCTEYDNKTICIGSPPNSWNFTISFNKTANTTAMVYCVYPNGTWTFENLMACEGNGNYTYLVSNLTHMWVKLNESYENPVNMTEIEPLTEGGNFEASGIKWYVRKIGKVWNCQPNCNWYDSDMWFLVTAENFFDLQGVSNQFNCSDPVSVRFNVSETYPENFAGVFCVLNQTTEVYESCGGQQNKANKTAFNLVSGSCPSNEGNTIYIYSNSTHLWINGTADLTKSSPLTNGDTLIIGEREWKVSSVGENEQGNPQLNMFNVMVNDLVRICMNQQQCFNLTVADKYENNRGSVFCVQGNGEWSDQNLAGCTPKIYIYSNTTHVWLNGSNDLTETPVRSKNNIFDFAGRTWKIADLDENKLEVKLAGNRICGWDDNQTYVLELPGEYEYNYHQYQRNLIDNWIKQDPKFVPFNYSRPVYIYHNTTHVWINNETNMSKVNPASINGILTDPYGGQWKVKLISKRSLKLEGQNVLAETGAFINTSYSRSGIIRIEPVREEWLGGWDQMQGKQRGFDLDGDGLTNGTVYIAVADNATAGIYDTFFFSKTNNFSNPISINANPSQRKFGYGENKLTLLSISSVSGVQVKAYSDKPSDWANLGQFKVGSVVRVPVIVKMPSGDDGVANVSVNIIKIEIPGQPSQFITLLSPPHAIIDGIGEITINFTTINLNQSGEYSLGIRAVNESTEEKLEEWKWPRVMMKRFLADSSVGDGGYVGEFKQLPLYRYDWDNYGDWIPEIRTEVVQPTNTIFEGIFASVPQEIPHEQCPNFEDPAEAGTGQNWTFVLYNPFDYYLYINSQNESKVWIKKGDCNFTTNTQLKNVGEQVNLTFYGNTYMLYVLYVNVTEGSKAAFIGLPGVNSSVMKPIRMDGNRPTWRLMAVNISGTLYDVLMANSTNDYPMCTIQNFYECIKMAWFSTTGNFSEAIPAAIGQNFTSNLYLAKIGPGSWDMLTIGDFSQIASLNIHPAVDVRVRDNTPSYFAKLDESVLNLDLNKNGDLNDVFYAIAFDEKQDFSNTLTDVMVDDDWNITEDWWHDSLNNYKDFYGDETGIKEMRSGLPRGIWNGNIRFNESSENTPWEKRPEWDILLYNYTHMLLRKWKDWFNKNENITIVLRVFEFNQSGIANADVTIDKLMYYGSGFPIQLQTPQDYNTTVNVKTDANGYAVIKITRNSNWQLGQYNVRVKVSKEGKVETTDNWFNVQP